jgi:hypothetical protein
MKCFYHSNKGTEIIGIAAVTKEASLSNKWWSAWFAVDIKPLKKLRIRSPSIKSKRRKTGCRSCTYQSFICSTGFWRGMADHHENGRNVNGIMENNKYLSSIFLHRL